MIQFFQDAKHELSQITWLTQNQAIKLATVTLVFVITSAIVLWAVDTLLTMFYKTL